MYRSNQLALDPQQYEAAHLALLAGIVDTSETALEAALSKLEAHTLGQQNGAALMDRVDTKYLLPKAELGNLLATLSEEYTVLRETDKRIFTYQTTYFDTADKLFYLAHHNGKLNRHKVRYRRYVESNIGFMEVKLKNNKYRTIKQRVPMDCRVPDQDKINQFVNECIGNNDLKLETTLFVNYRRITLLNKHRPERLTIDVDLSFQCAQSAHNGESCNLSDVFIVEVKREGKQLHSSFSCWVKQLGFAPINFSKYCMGMILTHDAGLKHNRFNKTIAELTKLSPHTKLAGAH